MRCRSVFFWPLLTWAHFGPSSSLFQNGCLIFLLRISLLVISAAHSQAESYLFPLSILFLINFTVFPLAHSTLFIHNSLLLFMNIVCSTISRWHYHRVGRINIHISGIVLTCWGNMTLNETVLWFAKNVTNLIIPRWSYSFSNFTSKNSV